MGVSEVGQQVGLSFHDVGASIDRALFAEWQISRPALALSNLIVGSRTPKVAPCLLRLLCLMLKELSVFDPQPLEFVPFLH